MEDQSGAVKDLDLAGGKIPCNDPSCNRKFRRQCDLSKHKQTHLRAHKCREPTCIYCSLGFPTEKELDRHVNDKHSSTPIYHSCRFCTFKTKRESNCKQHMEKRHGWGYVRKKVNDKTTIRPLQGRTLSSPAHGGRSANPTIARDDHSPRTNGIVIHNEQRAIPEECFPTSRAHNTLAGLTCAILPNVDVDSTYPTNGRFGSGTPASGDCTCAASSSAERGRDDDPSDADITSRIEFWAQRTQTSLTELTKHLSMAKGTPSATTLLATPRGFTAVARSPAHDPGPDRPQRPS